METTPRNIKVRYTSIDRFSQSRRFRTLAGAQAYAQKWVGPTPEVSDNCGYAVSGDGVGKVECEGCQIRALFPKLQTLVEILRDDDEDSWPVRLPKRFDDWTDDPNL